MRILYNPKQSLARKAVDGDDDGSVNSNCHGYTGGVSLAQNGWVITQPEVIPIFWDPYFSTTPDAVQMMTQFVLDLVTGKYIDGLAQYGVGKGTVAAPIVIDTHTFPAPSVLNPPTMESQLKAWFDKGVVPSPAPAERSKVYLILPPAASTLYDSTGSAESEGFCGYHQHFNFNASGDDNAIWAIVNEPTSYPSTGLSYVNSISYCVSHELCEAFTNPSGQGYESSTGCEVSDICEVSPGTNTVLTVSYDLWSVEKYWSQSANSCLAPPADNNPDMNWGVFQPLPGGGTMSSGLAAVSWGANRLDLFGLGENQNVWHMWFDGGNWNPSWQQLLPTLGALPFSGAPSAVSRGSGLLDVFGLVSDNNFWQTQWTGSAWTPWTPVPGGGQFMGGELIAGPAAVSWGANRLDLFGVGQNGQVWHNWASGANWNNWVQLPALPSGMQCASKPAAISTEANSINIFIRSSDGNFWQLYGDGTNWNGWYAMPGNGSFLSAPAAVTWGPSFVEVFGLGGDLSIWRSWWNGSQWNGWYEMLSGFRCQFGPVAAASWQPGRVDLFGVRLNYDVWHSVGGNGS